MNSQIELGPLAALVGTWEGDEGLDLSFYHGPEASAETAFRERATFEPFGPVQNGPQVLYGLDYRTTAWPRGEDDPFHMEVGYWLWDAAAGQVMRCFMVPRGATVLAGGDAAADARTFTMKADAGEETFGIVQNPHLARAAKTVHYEVTVEIQGGDVFSYQEDTVLSFANQSELFHHTDRNRLRRVS